MHHRDDHHHPCDTCHTPVACDAPRSENYDGWPEVICAAYHADFRGPCQCDPCIARDAAAHAADLVENV